MNPGPHQSKASSSEFRVVYGRSDFNIGDIGVLMLGDNARCVLFQKHCGWGGRGL